MLETITAVYRSGVLYPIQPLNLKDDQTVELRLISTVIPDLLAQLRDSGFVTIADPSSENMISDQDLQAFVNTLPMTSILTSEIIIEERGPW